jgi:acyl dehydratase
MTTVLSGIDEIKSRAGTHLGYSDWVEITQEMVNQFADATGDHQWIHVDVERAKAESPFGGPIAHGYLTLSLGPRLIPRIVRVEGFRLGVNYGANKVRFPSPVPVGAKLRAGAQLDSVDDVAGGIQVQMTVTFEVDGSPKPACVAEILTRYLV